MRNGVRDGNRILEDFSRGEKRNRIRPTKFRGGYRHVQGYNREKIVIRWR